MYYTHTIGGRWTSYPVAYKTLEDAEREAIRSSLDASEVRLWDCTKSPQGTLLGRYRNGALSPDSPKREA